MGVLRGIQLEPIEIAQLAYQVGLRDMGITVAVAVCRAESFFYTEAYNGNEDTSDESFGLWQINMLGDLRAERLKKYKLESEIDLYNPLVNARIMADMSKGGTNWKPWGAYTNGTFLEHMYVALRAKADLDREFGIAYVPPPFPGLTPNTAVPSAANLQHALKASGFLKNTVKTSDWYGPATQAAVKDFHKAYPVYGQPDDPAIGPKGWAKIHHFAFGV